MFYTPCKRVSITFRNLFRPILDLQSDVVSYAIGVHSNTLHVKFKGSGDVPPCERVFNLRSILSHTVA